MSNKKEFPCKYADNFKHCISNFIVLKVNNRGDWVEFWTTPKSLVDKSSQLKNIYSKSAENTDLYVGKNFQKALKIKVGDEIKGVVVDQQKGNNKKKPLLVWCWLDEEFNVPSIGNHEIYNWTLTPEDLKPKKTTYSKTTSYNNGYINAWNSKKYQGYQSDWVSSLEYKENYDPPKINTNSSNTHTPKTIMFFDEPLFDDQLLVIIQEIMKNNEAEKSRLTTWTNGHNSDLNVTAKPFVPSLTLSKEEVDYKLHEDFVKEKEDWPSLQTLTIK